MYLPPVIWNQPQVNTVDVVPHCSVLTPDDLKPAADLEDGGGVQKEEEQEADDA